MTGKKSFLIVPKQLYQSVCDFHLPGFITFTTEVFLHENLLAENDLRREQIQLDLWFCNPEWRPVVPLWLIEMQLLIITFILEVEATWLGKMSLVMLPEASKDVKQSEQK